LIYLQTSDRATTVLRLRSTEEIAAKRARRKKREREKEKEKEKGAKGKGKKLTQEEIEPNGDAEGEGQEEVKWEERVTVWCTVRANAKVKSFALPSDGSSTKAGVPVSIIFSFLIGCET
jgi:U3 small nucleolar RNA-associated protein 12